MKKNKRRFHVPVFFSKMGQSKPRDPEPDPDRKLLEMLDPETYNEGYRRGTV
jgi:hypothetical protein